MTQTQRRYGPLQYAIIILTLATAIIHISLLFPDPLFILNGLGYLVLLGALYLPVSALATYRGMVRWLLIGYTALTVALWLFLPGSPRSWPAFTDKAIEIALFVLLWVEGQRESLGR